MSAEIIPHHHPWYNRWTSPSLEELIATLKASRRGAIDKLMNQLAAMSQVRRTLDWYGSSWGWSLRYDLLDEQQKEAGVLCYLVLNPEEPQVCVPMSQEQVDQLPIKRLNRAIREGIDTAKCAVSTHWAVWTPTNQSEAGHILDLLNRLIQLRQPEQPKPKAKEPDPKETDSKEADKSPQPEASTGAASQPAKGSSKKSRPKKSDEEE
jgi:hypothetical protein